MTTPIRRDLWSDDLTDVERGVTRAIKALFQNTADALDLHDRQLADLASEIKRLRISLNAFTTAICLATISICATIIIGAT